MESFLSIWIEKQVHDKVPQTKSVIQEKPKKLYKDIEQQSLSIIGTRTLMTGNQIFQRVKAASKDLKYDTIFIM